MREHFCPPNLSNEEKRKLKEVEDKLDFKEPDIFDLANKMAQNAGKLVREIMEKNGVRYGSIK